MNSTIFILRKTGLLSLFKNPKYRLKLSALIQKRVDSNLNENVAIIGDVEGNLIYNFKFESDYGGTAACAVAFGDLLYEDKFSIKGVLFPFQIFTLEMIQNKVKHKFI